MDDFPSDIADQAKVFFDKYDLNKNKVIDPEELKLLMTDVSKEIGIPVPCDEDLAKVMDDIDLNRDEQISQEEFLNLFKIIYMMKKMK